MAIILVIFFGILICYMIKEFVYNSSEHTSIEDVSKLRADAKIIDIKRESVGRKETSAIRTTVFFDDGFTYISHKAKKSQILATIQITVTEEIAKEIMLDAIKAHGRGCKTIYAYIFSLLNLINKKGPVANMKEFSYSTGPL